MKANKTKTNAKRDIERGYPARQFAAKLRRLADCGASLLLVVALGLAAAGCSDPAAELLSTAQLEEKQNATDHARVLYEQIVADHPDSPQASVARARLEALGKSPAAAQ